MSLCLDCGLCCDGSLFYAVPVTRDEVLRLGTRVDFSEDGAQMMQCCRALEGNRCTVYDERPSTCRTYRCFVLSSFERGAMSEAEARAALDELRELVRAVSLATGVADQREAVRTARAAMQAGSASDEVTAAMRKLGRAALLLQLPPLGA
jgi:Fe-S-cluster containining protein